MIYGHQCEPGWSTRRFCVSMTLATALGAGLGLLFAPQRGSDTRHSLGAAVTRLSKLDRCETVPLPHAQC